MASIRENLVAAKALITDEAKWLKGGFREGDCFCAMGALGYAATKDEMCWRAEDANALIREMPSGYFRNIPTFNDAEATTHADIMELFDRAIAAQGERP